MKRFLYIILAALMALTMFACDEQAEPIEEGEPVYYEGHGIKMQVPAIWQETFVSYYKEYGEGESAYTTLEFMTVVGGEEAGVMAIASFTDAAWQTMVASYPDAEDMKIGTSKDGKTHYTVRFDDTTEFEKSDEQEKFDQIIEAAKEKSKTIEILN